MLIGLLIPLLSGCTNETTAPTVDDRSSTRAALDAAQRRWASLGLADYHYSFRRSCFCPRVDAVRITVSGGRVTDVRLEATGEPLPVAGYPAVDGLFAEVRRALDMDAHEIQASYDAALGYPVRYYIDLLEHAIDEEQRVETADLRRGGE